MTERIKNTIDSYVECKVCRVLKKKEEIKTLDIGVIRKSSYRVCKECIKDLERQARNCVRD